MGKTGRTWVSWTLILLGLAGVAWGQAIVPFGFVDEPVVTSGFSFPVDMCWLNTDGEERLVVLEKAGEVKLVVNGVVEGTFINISEKVSSYLDRGLLTCLVDVDVKGAHPYLYLGYVVKNPGQHVSGDSPARVVRYNVNPSLTAAAEESETILIGSHAPEKCDEQDFAQDMVCCTGPMHCLGGLAQTADGNIFMGVGDGCRANVPSLFVMESQKLTALVGKILRVDRQGLGLVTNPFWETGMALSENTAKVWSLGVRNPFRLSLDPVRQIPLISEVGWSTYEEINWGERAANLEWPCLQGVIENAAYQVYEGCITFPDHGNPTGPLEYYPRSVGHSSTGVIRLDFPSWPAKFRNKIYHTDYVFGWLKMFAVNPITNQKVADSSEDFALGLKGPVKLLDAPNDQLWYINIESREIRCIRYDPDPSPPRVVRMIPPAEASAIEITTAFHVTFSKPLLESSLTAPGNILLHVVGDATALVDCVISYDAATWTVIITPSYNLATYTGYELTLQDLTDPLGVALSAPYTSTFTTSAAQTVYISDLDFMIEVNGLGPVALDVAPAEKPYVNPIPIQVRGEQFSKGLGVAAISQVRVAVPAGCSQFEAIVGLDDSASNYDTGMLFFEVVTDLAEVLYTSRIAYPEGVNRITPGLQIVVNVEGAAYIDLLVDDDGFGRPKQNLGCWAAARFRCGDFDDAAPEVTSMTPVDGAMAVPVDNPSISITFSESMNPLFILSGIEVSLDGELVGWEPVVNGNADIVQVVVRGVLEYDSIYVVKATLQLRDLGGNRLVRTEMSTFTTEAAPTFTGDTLLTDLTPYQVDGQAAKFTQDESPVLLANDTKAIKDYWKGLSMIAPASLDFVVPESCTKIQGFAGMDITMMPPADSESTVPDACAFSIRYADTNSLIYEITRTASQGEKWFRTITIVAGRTVRLSSTPVGGEGAANPAVCNYGKVRFLCNTAPGSRYLSSIASVGQEGTISFNRAFGIGGPLRFARSSVLAYGSGLQMKAWTRLHYNIPDNCSTFRSDCGLDALLARKQASMQFKFQLNNGRSSCQSSLLTVGDAVESINCPLEGASVMKLILSRGPDTEQHDFGAIGNPRFECQRPYTPPRCEITSLTETFRVGQEISFSGVAIDSSGAVMNPSNLSWRIVQHHCSVDTCHKHEVKTINGVSGDSFLVDDHGDEFRYEVICSVCDGSNCYESSKQSFPEMVDVTVDSSPEGLIVGVDSGLGAGPITRRVVIGARIIVSAGDTQGEYIFDSWAQDISAGSVFAYTVQSDDPVYFLATFRVDAVETPDEPEPTPDAS